jgi:ferritin-like metal-binding protein YciE
VAEHDLQEKLNDHIKGAQAMEQNVKRMLDSMIGTTEDPQIKGELEHHREETERHEQLLRERLEARGEGTSTVKEATGIGGALLKGVGDMMRSEKPVKNARDGYVTEHMEIAEYEMLERLAKRAGDDATAEVARRNCVDERAMADKIEHNWDKFVDLMVREEALA